MRLKLIIKVAMQMFNRLKHFYLIPSDLDEIWGATEHIAPVYLRMVESHWQTVAKLPLESMVAHIT